jgi:hypothetical protein
MAPLPAWALKPDYTYTGLVIAGSIILAWASALRHALMLEMQTASRLHIAVLFTSLIELNTALFITAHDAMHGHPNPSTPPRVPPHALEALHPSDSVGSDQANVGSDASVHPEPCYRLKPV